jgi:hypothetical protein
MNGFGGDVPFWMPAVLLLVLAAGVLFWGSFFRFLIREFRGEPNKPRVTRQRGFEVKRTTGETPVLLKERENDHG